MITKTLINNNETITINNIKTLFNKHALILTLLLLLNDRKVIQLVQVVNSTIIVPSTYGTHKYDSQTARFGMVFEKSKIYEARLQVHDGDPYLCGDGDGSESSSSSGTTAWPISHTYNDIIVPRDGRPVALLAKRGQCSFEAKARRALTLLPQPRYVIVYDDKERPTLSIMSAIDTTSNNISNIGLLFISFHSGVDLLVQLMSQPASIKADGGYIIKIDSVNPWLPFIKADTQSWLIASLTGIFLIFICFGCVFFFVHVGCLRIEANVIYLRRGGGNGNRNGTNNNGRYSLLTREQVMNLPQIQYDKVLSSNSNSNSATNNKEIESSSEKSEIKQNNSHFIGSSCPICLDDYTIGQTLCQLQPCKHLFHTSCILPWLTERQPFCPLCKTQVIVNTSNDQQQQNNNYNSISTTTSSSSSTSIIDQQHSQDENDTTRTTTTATATTNRSTTNNNNSNNRQLFSQRLRYWTFNYHNWWNNNNDNNEEERLLLS